ncbi:MAG: hypothetical protein M1814_001016 [Vezdaea aestivalis]|nr:MAG: hypothetical protein M1814_001016 [Vezdaea aestivalis]
MQDVSLFVCATDKLQSDPVLLRSYHRRSGDSNRLRAIKIWETARATAAISSFFDPVSIKIGNADENFADDITRASNPIQELWNETKHIWNSESLEDNLKCLVSIGSGVPSADSYATGLIEVDETLIQISNRAERQAESFVGANTLLVMSGRYFRFNVRNSLEKSQLRDVYQKDEIQVVNQGNKTSKGTVQSLEDCAATLAERASAVSLRKSQSTLPKASEQFGHEYDRLIEGISLYDHRKIHQRLSHKRLYGTTKWLSTHLEFNNWIEGKGSRVSSCIRTIGSGKTIIATAIVDDLTSRSRADETATIYYYCKNSQTDVSQGLSLLKSSIKQILIHFRTKKIAISEEINFDIRKFFGKRRLVPDFDDSANLFSKLFLCRKSAAYILDGIDKLESHEVRKLLKLVKKLSQTDSDEPGPRIALLSRVEISAPHPAILDTIPNAAQTSTFDVVSDDIRTYIQYLISEKTAYSRELTDDAVLQDEMERSLLHGAKGKFLWIYLQVEIFTLEETLEACFDQTDRESAKDLLNWISYASRPLRVGELQEVVSFDLQDRHWSFKSCNVMALIDNCANLVVKDATDDCVRFAHPAFKQYYIHQYSRGSKESGEGQLRCGEISVAYLSFSALNPPSNSNESATQCHLVPVVGGSVKSALSTVKRVFKRTASDIEEIVPPLRPLQTYQFLNYAVENWALQTKRISEQSVVWDLFQQFAIHLNGSYHFHPLEGSARDSYSSHLHHLHRLLGCAIEESHVPLLKAILRIEPEPRLVELCRKPPPGYCLTLLHMASRAVLSDIFALLLPHCSAHAPGYQGINALTHAAEKGHVTILARLLKDRKCLKAISKRGPDGCTPLHWAVRGQKTAAQLLLQNGANIEARNKYGWTPLHWAAIKGHNPSVEVLLNNGADIEVQARKRKRTALHEAAKHGHETTSTGYLGYTALHSAVLGGHVSIARFLLESGAEFEVRPTSFLGSIADTYTTPLHWAAQRGDEAMARLLVEWGIDVAQCGWEFHTALHHAAERGHESIVCLLLEHGADVNAEDQDFWTPLSHAKYNKHEAVARILESAQG